MTDPRADTYTHSGLSARVFPANEELMTARHTAALLGIFPAAAHDARHHRSLT
jgi:hypothetical protein